MKVLITGGAGFIGSHLAKAWADNGASVVVLDSLRSGYRHNLEGVPCEFIEGTVEDAATVEMAMRGARIVHHLAALVSVPESMAKPAETERLNVLGTLNVLEAARKFKARVVLSSTSAVYGMAERPIHSEDHLPEPASPYAITKLAAEHYCQLYRQAHGVETVVLRYFNVFGPRQDPRSAYAAAVAIFTDKAKRGEDLKIYGDGQQTRDFIFVEDIVAANLLVAEKGSGVFNVSTGEKITVNDLAKAIITVNHSTSKIIHEPVRPGDVLHSRGDSRRLQSLGWKPAITLMDGLRRMA